MSGISSERERERERESSVKLLEISTGDRWVFIGRGMGGICELGV